MGLIGIAEFGFPVAGPIDAGGAGIRDPVGRLARGKSAACECSDLRQPTSVNAATIAQARPGPHAAAVWAKHKVETIEGKVGPPIRLAEFDQTEGLLVENFGVEEARGGRTKLRIIDNFRRNSVNAYSSVWEIWNDGLDHLIAAVLRLQSARKVLIGKDDFVGAFKTVCPSADEQWPMWALLYNTDSQEWVVCELHTQPFGALGGVHTWWRCAPAKRAILRPPVRPDHFLLCRRHLHG